MRDYNPPRVLASGTTWFEGLDAFTQGYVSAMCGEAYNPQNIRPVDQTRIEMECEQFQRETADVLRAANLKGDYNLRMAGRDLWLARRGEAVIPGVSLDGDRWPFIEIHTADNGELFLF